MSTRSSSPDARLLSLFAAALLSCYAPGHWEECRIQCSTSGGCPSDTRCGSDGYCHRDPAHSCGGIGGGGSDVTAPTFAGAAVATAGINSIVLDWLAASDDVTPAAQIVYLVFQSSQPGGEDFTASIAGTSPGATSLAVPGLLRSTSYDFVVRARDQAGNVDGNHVEVSAKTLDGNDTVAPTFAGLTGAQATAPNVVGLSWAPASDDVTGAGGIVYFAYVSTRAGGEDFSAPAATSPAGVTSLQVGGLTPATPYFFVVRARDQAGNVDTNLVERSATPFADTTAPSFAGATKATATGLTSIRVDWSAASDDATPANEILYDVYVALIGGHEGFGKPSATSAPGATSVVVGGLLPVTTYFFVVRARDHAGNADANTVEVSASTPLL
jgi:chitodextrinase